MLYQADREVQGMSHCSMGNTGHQNKPYTRWHSAVPSLSCTCQGDTTAAPRFPPGSRTLVDRCRHPDPAKGWSCWSLGCSNTQRYICLWAGQGRSGHSIHRRGRAHSLTGMFGESSCCRFLQWKKRSNDGRGKYACAVNSGKLSYMCTVANYLKDDSCRSFMTKEHYCGRMKAMTIDWHTNAGTDICHTHTRTHTHKHTRTHTHRQRLDY